MIAAFFLAATTATAPPELDGITIGENVAAVISQRGVKSNSENPTVENTALGHVWTWVSKDGTKERVTTNDDGVVQMVEILASPENEQSVAVPVAGSLQFNESGHINAQPADRNFDLFLDEWLPAVNVAGTVVGYAIEPNYGVLFGFRGPGDGGLIEVFTGTRESLFTTGLVPVGGDPPTPLRPTTLRYDIYNPPRVVQIPPCGGFIRGRVVFVRLEVGSDGHPTNATVFAGLPPGSADDSALYCPMHSKFEPATLDGKRVPSVIFQKRII